MRKLHEMMKWIVPSLALLATTHTPCQAQYITDTGITNPLQRSIDYIRSTYYVKGISAAAWVPGRGMWKGVTGVSYPGQPIDTTMLFSIGSVTKTFVAAQTLKLVEAGTLSLDDTIGALLPPMPNINPSVKVRQLLSHTSGLGEYLGTPWQTAMLASPTTIWYFPEALNAFATPPVGPAGSPFAYCNTNYLVLGKIIESKTGDSLHKVLRTNFLMPYSLNNTYMEAIEHYTNPIPHNWSTPTMSPSAATDASGVPHEALWSSIEPSGGYFSDPADMAMWGYHLYAGHVLSPSSMSEMLNFMPLTGYFNGYGLGAMRFPAGTRNFYGHGGNFFGYAAAVLFNPEDSICVAMLVNQDCIATNMAKILMNELIKQMATAKVNVVADSKQIHIAPNPANTHVTVSVPPALIDATVQVHDLTDKTLYTGNLNNHTAIVPVSTWVSGTYIVQVTAGQQVFSSRFSVQH